MKFAHTSWRNTIFLFGFPLTAILLVFIGGLVFKAPQWVIPIFFFAVMIMSCVVWGVWYIAFLRKCKPPPIFPKRWEALATVLLCYLNSVLCSLAIISINYNSQSLPEAFYTYSLRSWSSGFGILSNALVLPGSMVALLFLMCVLMRQIIILINEKRLKDALKDNATSLILLLFVIILLVSKTYFSMEKLIIPSKYNVHGWDSRFIGDFGPYPWE